MVVSVPPGALPPNLSDDRLVSLAQAVHAQTLQALLGEERAPMPVGTACTRGVAALQFIVTGVSSAEGEQPGELPPDLMASLIDAARRRRRSSDLQRAHAAALSSPLPPPPPSPPPPHALPAERSMAPQAPSPPPRPPPMSPPSPPLTAAPQERGLARMSPFKESSSGESNEDISALIELLISPSMSQAAAGGGGAAAPAAAPGGMNAAEALLPPPLQLQAAQSDVLTGPRLEGIPFIWLVRPCVVLCDNGGAPHGQPQHAPAPASGISSGSQGTSASGSDKAAAAGGGRAVTLEVLASGLRPGASHELIVTCNGLVLARKECSGEHVAAGCLCIDAPWPQHEGVWQVGHMTCIK